MEGFARAVAAGLGVQGGAPAPSSPYADWIQAVVSDLQKNRGKSIVIAGDYQPPVVHALAHAMNQALGNVGTTVTYVEPIAANPTNHIESIKELARDIAAGSVDTLIIIGGNPVFDAPVDLNFRELIQKVPFTAHLSLYNDETSAYCKWHIPSTHYLESWGDARTYEGTVTIIQPLIEPLYQGAKSAHEMVAAIAGQTDKTAYDIVREFWQANITRFGQAAPAAQPGAASGATPVAQSRAAAAAGGAARAAQPAPDAAATPPGGPTTGTPAGGAPAGGTAPAATSGFDKAWRSAVHWGFIPNTAAKPRPVTPGGSLPAAAAGGNAPALEVVFRPDPSI
jgi:molybdopterin-containing oxidoreductase family iron-sulfur binding subunit